LLFIDFSKGNNHHFGFFLYISIKNDNQECKSLAAEHITTD